MNEPLQNRFKLQIEALGGFDFQDFELAQTEMLTIDYPQYEQLIKGLCRLW